MILFSLQVVRVEKKKNSQKHSMKSAEVLEMYRRARKTVFCFSLLEQRCQINTEEDLMDVPSDFNPLNMWRAAEDSSYTRAAVATSSRSHS
jgi:hypothetical protein